MKDKPIKGWRDVGAVKYGPPKSKGKAKVAKKTGGKKKK